MLMTTNSPWALTLSWNQGGFFTGEISWREYFLADVHGLCSGEIFPDYFFTRGRVNFFYVGLSGVRVCDQIHGRPQAWARGDLPISGDVVKCFVHCKTLSRRIIYALFSQPVVGFWRLRTQTPTAAPSLICPPGKNPALMSGLLCSITSFHVYRL